MRNRAMAFFICFVLCLNLILAFPFPSVAAQVSAFSVKITIPPEVYTEDSITVTFSLKDIDVPLAGLEFVFYFDNTLLTPIITENTADEMDAFIHTSPQNSWEQLCRYDGVNSRYHLRFSAPDGGMDESTHIKTENDLIIIIPFVAVAEGACELNVPDRDIIGVDASLGLLSGKGASLSFDIVKCVNIHLKEDSGFIISRDTDTAYLSGVRENTAVSVLLEKVANGNVTLTDSLGNIVTDHNSICKTGYILSLYDAENLVDRVVIIIKGDLNRDGMVTAADYLFVKRAFLGTITLDNSQLQAAYLTSSNTITAVTYYMLKRHVLGTYDIYA